MTLPTLSQRLREETAAAHADAEHSTFMADLLAGTPDVSAFIALQEQSLMFYTAIEAATEEMRADARVAPIADARLARAPRLEADLATLGSTPAPRALPSTTQYVTELERIRDEVDAPALIAHHYVRYLGDLSGGQIISRRMQQNYGLGERALSFYRFEGIEKLKPFKDNYRAALDALELTPAESDAVITHAKRAFGFNQRVFRDLGEWLADATLRS